MWWRVFGNAGGLQQFSVSAAVAFLLPHEEGWWWWSVKQSVPTCRHDHAPGLLPAHTLVILAAVGTSDLALSVSLSYGSSQVPLPGISWTERGRVLVKKRAAGVRWLSFSEPALCGERRLRHEQWEWEWGWGGGRQVICLRQKRATAEWRYARYYLSFLSLFCMCGLYKMIPKFFKFCGKTHTGVLSSCVCFGLTSMLTESALPKLRQLAVALSSHRLTKQKLCIIYNVSFF